MRLFAHVSATHASRATLGADGDAGSGRLFNIYHLPLPVLRSHLHTDSPVKFGVPSILYTVHSHAPLVPSLSSLPTSSTRYISDTGPSSSHLNASPTRELDLLFGRLCSFPPLHIPQPRPQPSRASPPSPSASLWIYDRFYSRVDEVEVCRASVGIQHP